jgi:hypothetical protein
MPGRAMIVGRATRTMITGADPYAGLREYAGAEVAPPMPAPPMGHPHHPGHHHPGHHPGYGWGGVPIHHPAHPQYHHRPGYGVPYAYTRSDAPSIEEIHPTHPREFPIGFSSEVLPDGVVPAGQTEGIEQKPQVLFRGERLAVPNSEVLNFDIEDIKVGKDSQLASPGSMPSECFSNLSVGVRMQLDTAEPGITITLFVTNDDVNNDHVFKSCLFGTVIE